ncbi:MAG TPA: hypothetical protein VMT51_09040 [Dongiaceae bacterium]|nr:hypothetical protein [Dongiaceae bacterium]
MKVIWSRSLYCAALALCALSVSCSVAYRRGGEVQYDIKFVKDHNTVTATYSLNVHPGGSELLSDLKIYVDGKNLIDNFKPGQIAFNSSSQAVLEHPDRDVTVSFVVSTNQAWSATESAVLRGGKTYDDAEFSR